MALAVSRSAGHLGNGALVRKLLDAKGQGPQVAVWERELNALVYELYGLTEEEIGIIEATVGR